MERKTPFGNLELGAILFYNGSFWKKTKIFTLYGKNYNAVIEDERGAAMCYIDVEKLVIVDKKRNDQTKIISFPAGRIQQTIQG